MSDDASRVVTKESLSDVRSALVKAFDTWTEPYDIAPDGVFGSVATIKSGQVTISSDTLDVEFTVPFDDDMEPNEAEIVVYNLSNGTIQNLNRKAEITIEAGYKGDTGVLFKGFITKIKTEYDGADKVTTIYAMDDIKDHTITSITFAAGTKASYILRRLIDMTGLPVAVFKWRRNHTYTDAQTVDGDLMENIKKYADVCGVSVFVSKGKIYARHLKNGTNINFVVSSATGMIGSPSSYTEEVKAEDYTETINGYKVEMLLQHRMCPGAIVDLKSKVASGTYRICSGTHRFSESEATTEVKMY